MEGKEKKQDEKKLNNEVEDKEKAYDFPITSACKRA